jgi:hypothetical protein
MKRASIGSILVTTFFYLCCGCFGYAAFGSDSPGNLLTGFGFYEPYWLIDFANACIILHLLGGYQVSTRADSDSPPKHESETKPCRCTASPSSSSRTGSSRSGSPTAGS